MKNYRLLQNPEHLQRLVGHYLEKQKPIGFDIETGYDEPAFPKKQLRPEANHVSGFSITNSTDGAFYIPLRHELSTNVDPEYASRIMKPLAASGLLVAHNAKFEDRSCTKPVHAGGLDLSFKWLADTMLEAYVLAEWESNGLKELSEACFGYKQADIESLFIVPGMKLTKKNKLTKKDKDTINFSRLPLRPDVVAYAGDDAWVALALHLRHREAVQANFPFIYKLEMSILPIAIGMEEAGLYYDWSVLEDEIPRLERWVNDLEREIKMDLEGMCGRSMEKLNLASPPQKAKILYEELKMPVTKKTDTGNPSVDEQALTALAKKYPVVAKMLYWTQAQKLMGTYLKKYLDSYRYAEDGRTHPSLLQHGVNTGRWAVTDPAYHSTPKVYNYPEPGSGVELHTAGPYTFNMRTAIQPEPGRYFLYFDYSQIELRWMCGVSGEPSMMEAFEKGEDIHKATAMQMLGRPNLEAVSEADRDKGKTLNFALLYGMGETSLGQRLAISKAEADRLYASYFETFTAIDTWVEKAKTEGVRRGYTMSYFGRRVTVWELKSRERWIYSKGERICVNAPIQGGAADYMKISMVRQDTLLAKLDLKARIRLVMNNHDSLCWEVDEDIPPLVAIETIRPSVEWRIPGFPPIVAEWGVGYDWANIIKVEKSADGWHAGKAKVEVPQDVTAPELVRLANGGGVRPVQVPSTQVEEAVAAAPVPSAHIETVPTPEPVREAYNWQPAEQPTLFTATPERVAPDDDGKVLEVEMATMPSAQQYQRWLELLQRKPGPNRAILMTPEGVLEEDTGHGLTEADWPLVSTILGGVCKWAYSSVDAGELLADLTL